MADQYRDKFAMAVEIKEHPTSAEHKLAIVTTPKGYRFAASWAEPFPTSAEQVLEAFKDDKRRVDFLPYNP